ncbi:hypothetical protein [Brevibacillus panacihumi]|uniref:hypothetical protein n=1 Tax=Brevibacillus panacihumi TaxID=497735 RepID=UPI003D1DC5C7
MRLGASSRTARAVRENALCQEEAGEIAAPVEQGKQANSARHTQKRVQGLGPLAPCSTGAARHRENHRVEGRRSRCITKERSLSGKGEGPRIRGAIG